MTLLMLGTDFPYPQFFPSHAKVIQVDLRGEPDRPPHEGRPRPRRLHQGHPLRAPSSAHNKDGPCSPRRKDERLQKSSRGLDELAGPDNNKTPIHPQYVAQTHRQARSRRRHLYLRRRHPHRLGGALSHHERAPPPPRLLLARIDGLRRPAGHWRTIRLSPRVRSSRSPATADSP